MPEARTLFPELEALDHTRLRVRYEELLTANIGLSNEDIPDERLREMVVILGMLRRKSAGPPKARAPKAAPPTLDQL